MADTYKEFDWNVAKAHHSPSRVQWLWENHKRPITEDKFVADLQAIRHLGKTRNYSPSKLRRTYQDLKKVFGFFK